MLPLATSLSGSPLLPGTIRQRRSDLAALLLIGATLLAPALSWGAGVPIEVTGWNTDLIFEAAPTSTISEFFSPNDKMTWAENGTVTGVSCTGFPSSRTFTSGAAQYQFQPYTQNNAFWAVGSTNLTATLVTPAKYKSISLLHSSEGFHGNWMRVSIRLRFTDHAEVWLKWCGDIGWPHVGRTFDALSWGQGGSDVAMGLNRVYHNGLSASTSDPIQNQGGAWNIHETIIPLTPFNDPPASGTEAQSEHLENYTLSAINIERADSAETEFACFAFAGESNGPAGPPANTAPVVTITAPTANQVQAPGTTTVTVTANATTDDAITGWSIVQTDGNGAHAPWTGAGTGANGANISNTFTVIQGATTFTVTATDAGALSGSATVTTTVPDSSPPTVATPAAATPTTVTGTTSTLSVLGADNAGEGGLSYTWAVAGAPVGGTATFSANGANGAKNTVATFTAAGTYTLPATIADASNNTVTSTVVVTVLATATTLAVTPVMPLVPINTHQLFAVVAKDQFNAVMAAPAVTWTVSGGGSIAANGDFTAGGIGGGPYTATATGGGLSGSADLMVDDGTPWVATVAITPAGGTLNCPVPVTMTCATAGAEIRYTLDGTTPTIASTLYAAPFSVTTLGPVVVKARASHAGMQTSPPVTATYTIANSGPVPPTVSEGKKCGTGTGFAALAGMLLLALGLRLGGRARAVV
jgi:hypothetical protein